MADVGEKEERIVLSVGRTSRPRSYTLLLSWTSHLTFSDVGSVTTAASDLITIAL